MANEAIYTTELELFRKKYNMPSYDLRAMVAVEQKIRLVSETFSLNLVGNADAAQYKSLFEKTLHAYFETNTKLNADGKYMTGFYPQTFLRDFEKLSSAIYFSQLEQGQEPKRKKFEGAKKKELKAIFLNYAQEKNKTLPSFWKEKLRKGLMDFDGLRETTNDLYSKMTQDNADKEAHKGSLNTMIAAYEAMKLLRESRNTFFGWFWKIFKKERNQAEEDYLNTLETEIKDLKDKGYDVKGVTAQFADKTVFGLDVATEENLKEPVSDKIVRKLNHEFWAELKSEWRENIPEDIKLSDTTLDYAIKKPLLQGVLELNATYDKRVAEKNDPKKEMERVVNGVFKLAVNLSNKYITNRTALEKADAIKVIAQETVNKATAAAIYPGLLGNLVERCINQNVLKYKAITREGKDYLKEIEKYETDNAREQVFKNDKPFAQNEVSKSPQISKEPKPSVPTFNKGNKQ